MKKLLLIVATLVFCAFISCNENSGITVAVKDDSKIVKNKAASRAINNAFGTGDASVIDSVVADNFVDHTDRGDMGRDSLKSMIKMVHATNKNMTMDVLHEIGDDDYVYTWMRFTGTSDGTMMAAGPYDMTAIQVTKFKDGKAIEHWEFMEPREMMKMMPPAPGAK